MTISRRAGFIVYLSLSVFCSLGWSALIPTPETETLPNGLEIAWVSDPTLPTVQFTLVIPSGSRHDPAGSSGLHEILAASVLRGAGTRDSFSFARALEDRAAGFSTAVEPDWTTFSVRGFSEDSSLLVELLSDAIFRPKLTDTAVTLERSKIIEHWTQLQESIEALAQRAMERRVFSGTRYGQGGITSLAELERISPQSVRNAHPHFFQLGRAILLVGGRFDRSSVRAIIKKNFGVSFPDASPGPSPSPKSDARPPASTPDSAEAVWLVDRPGAQNATVLLAVRSPGLKSFDTPALRLANAVLGGGFQSRLNRRLREELGLTYGAGSSLLQYADVGALFLQASTGAQTVGQTLGELIRVFEEFRNPTEVNFSDREIDIARRFLLGQFPRAMETWESLAGQWLSWRAFGLPPEDLNPSWERIRTVSSIEVRRAIRSHWGAFQEPYVVISGDAKRITDKVKKKFPKNQKLRVVTVRDLF